MDKRIRHAGLAAKVTTAAHAAERIDHGMTIGMSGFTGAGYPKAVPRWPRAWWRRTSVASRFACAC
ncbi:hypothetical protein GCM10027021_07250 [Dyella kyungheensis]